MATYENVTGNGRSKRNHFRSGLSAPTSPHPVIAGMVHAARHRHAGNLQYLSHHTAVLEPGIKNGGGSNSIHRRALRGGGFSDFMAKVVSGLSRFFSSSIPGHLLSMGSAALNFGKNWFNKRQEDIARVNGIDVPPEAPAVGPQPMEEPNAPIA
jgi:hypothetical protein